MRILRIVIENFKSFRYRTQLTFPRTSGRDSRNIFLIGGMNGAGKTTLIECLNICLYGERKERIYRYVNRSEAASGNYNLELEVLLQTDDGDEIAIQRSWSCDPTLVVVRSNDLDEHLSIRRNGSALESIDTQIWQDFLNTTFPRGITQFFFFDGEKIQELASDDHAELKLKTSMESALGIELVKRLQADIDHLCGEERRKRSGVSDDDISVVEAEVKSLRTRQTRTKEILSETVGDLERFERERNDTRERFDAAFGPTGNLIDEHKKLDRKRIQASTKRGELESRVRDWMESRLALLYLFPLFESLKKLVETENEQRKVSGLQSLSDTLVEKLITQLFEPVSPCCHQELGIEELGV